MKRRVFPLALAAALLLTVSALAAPAAGGFVRSKVYEGQFSDLSADSVFYENVAALYEYGLSVGRADGTYGLQDSISLGEMVIFTGRIRSLYTTGDPEAGPGAWGGDGGPVSGGYLRYLQAEGVLGDELGEDLGRPATRAEVAHMLASVLPPEELPPINDSVVTTGYAVREFIPDVTEYTPYYQDILFLYRTGISAGGDAVGTFQPEAYITRGAAAAMLTRIADPNLRIVLDWTVSTSGGSSAQGTTLADLVPSGYYVATPVTEQQMEGCVQYMLSSGSNTLELVFPSGLNDSRAREIMNLALRLVKSYSEQGYNSVACNYNRLGEMTLQFSAVGQEVGLQDYRNYSIAAAVEVHDQLWENGYLTQDMTEYEKAQVYYNWICENCTYDYSAGDGSISHTPYSLFARGTAVCDGYTGAYNMFLKLEGISCYGLSNDDHIWTVATLDGTEVHIDTTWGDSSGWHTDYSFFAMTPEQSYRLHPW